MRQTHRSHLYKPTHFALNRWWRRPTPPPSTATPTWPTRRRCCPRASTRVSTCSASCPPSSCSSSRPTWSTWRRCPWWPTWSWRPAWFSSTSTRSWWVCLDGHYFFVLFFLLFFKVNVEDEKRLLYFLPSASRTNLNHDGSGFSSKAVLHAVVQMAETSVTFYHIWSTRCEWSSCHST